VIVSPSNSMTRHSGNRRSAFYAKLDFAFPVSEAQTPSFNA
jgi:hypothetical protein